MFHSYTRLAIKLLLFLLAGLVKSVIWALLWYIQAVDKSEYYRKRFGYPGKIKSYLNGELIDITRMFYGHCLKIGGQTVIFYSEYLGSDNKWHKGVYDVDFDGKNTIQNPAVIPYDTIKETEALVKKGRC